LKRRSTALKTALNNFNQEAKNLDHPTLDFKDLLSYSFVADLELLRDSREDIRSQPWTLPSVRQGMIAWLKRARAMEEIQRVKVEAARLRAWIESSSSKHETVIQGLRLSDPHLAMEFERRNSLQHLYDAQNLKFLTRMDRFMFSREERDRDQRTTPWTASDIAKESASISSSDDESNAEEDLVDHLEKLTDFFYDEPYLRDIPDKIDEANV
jgi:hypothetical protein